MTKLWVPRTENASPNNLRVPPARRRVDRLVSRPDYFLPCSSV